MDANTLLQCFACTLDHDATVRTNAEMHLKQASSTPGFLGACLDIIGSSEVPENIKLSASLYFKNKSTYGWSGKHYGKNEMLHYVVDNDEKPVIKDSLIQTMLLCSKNSPGSVRILKSALTVIIGEEYSQERWDTLLPQSLKLLSTDDIDMAYVGLICLSEIFRTYRWKENDARQELEVLILQYFPDLLQYANDNLLQGGKNMDDPKVGEMIKLILKIYKFVTYHDMPFTLQRTEMFIPWANFFVSVIQQPISERILTSYDEETRSNYSWVKCKKWSYAILYRLFQRYASESLTRKFSYEDFKALYRDQFLPQFLQLLFHQIEKWGTGNLWLSDASLYYVLSFIEQTIVQKLTWKLVRAHYNTILENVIFPLLTPNEEILDTFENDPQEYIHRNLELWDESYSPDLAAASLLTTSVVKRGKTTLQPTLEFVIRTLEVNVGDFMSITLANAVKIESCFRIFSCIIDRLTANHSPYLSEIEGFLKRFVFPFFKSPYGFLRTRVCEICSKLGTVDFEKSVLIDIIYEGIMSCLNENTSCLPVKLLAALALQTFIHEEQFQHQLSLVVLPTMEKLLELSNEFESDTISGVMQDFVEQFSEQLQPFGVELMNTLVQQFLKLAIDLHEASNVDPGSFIEAEELPDETDKQMAALGILSTAISILLSFENSPEILRNLEHSFYPAAEFILKNDIEDFYRECCEYVENSTFLLRDISPISWKILELIGDANSKEDSMVSFYLEDFMLVLNNYLIYGKNELRKNNFYSKILFEIYRRAALSEDSSLDELSVVFDLSQKLTLALQEDLPSSYRQRFLEDAIKAILVEKNELKKNIVFGVTTFNVVVSSIVCSPLLTLQFLKHHNCLEFFFETWLTFYIPNVKRAYDIKLYILALLSIICQAPAVNLAELSMQLALQPFGSIMVELVSRFPAALKSFEEKRKEYSSDEFKMDTFNDWDNEFGVENYAEDDENNESNNDIDEESLKEHLAVLKGDSDTLSFVHGNTFDDGEDFDDLEEDPLTGSILDDINIYDVIKSSVLNLQQADPNQYGALTVKMSAEDQAVLTQIINL